MICPQCHYMLPETPVVGALVICPACLRSVVLEADQARLATASDTQPLTDNGLAALRQARKRAREAQA